MFSKVLRPRVVGFPAELPHTASSQYGVSTPPAPRCGMRADVAALPGGPRARLSRVAVAAPPETFFVVSAIFHYLGPAFAVLLFVRVEPVGVAWLRIVFAAVVFAAWRRPWRAFQRLDRSEEHTSELQSRQYLVCRLLLEKKKKNIKKYLHNKKKKITQKR